MCTAAYLSEYQHNGHYLPTECEVDTVLVEVVGERMRSNYMSRWLIIIQE